MGASFPKTKQSLLRIKYPLYHLNNFPAIQVPCAAKTSPLHFMITHGSKNPAVIRCECLTYEAVLKCIKLRNTPRYACFCVLKTLFYANSNCTLIFHMFAHIRSWHVNFCCVNKNAPINELVMISTTALLALLVAVLGAVLFLLVIC